jgi:membrane protein
MNLVEIKNAADRLIWEPRLAELGPGHRFALQVARIGDVVVRDIARGQLNLQAMSLVYTTLLSIVPLLAVAFSVLKGFGVHNQIEPMIANLLEPLGPQGVEITQRIVGFVDNLRVGVLGAVGLGFLFVTVISLMQKIEGAFNYTWHVRHGRSFAQRFSDYLSVLIVGPVLVFSALGILASIMGTSLMQQLAAIEPFGTLIGLLTKLVPFLLIIGAFLFAYLFVPNTRVRPKAALVGALVAGALWQATGWGFASFIVTSTRYEAIYSAFATLVLFMIWLYLTWLILLVGASIAFYCQNPNYLTRERAGRHVSARMTEKLALLIMRDVGRRHYGEGEPCTLAALTSRLALPSEAVEYALDALLAGGLLKETADNPPMFLPGRPMDETKVEELLRIVRAHGEGSWFSLERIPDEAAVGDVLDALDATLTHALDGLTLKQLALGHGPSESTPKQVAHL